MTSKTLTIAGAILTAGLAAAPALAQDVTLRLSTLMQPDSPGAAAAEEFARLVNEGTDGRIEVRVYPASQLGDWVEVHEQVMQGAVDMALQPLSNTYDERLAITWFPYTISDYTSARSALSAGGSVYGIVNDIITDQGLTLLGVYGGGLGGIGFATEVANPTDPNASHDQRVRVWPGGTTHRVLTERYGYSTTTLPWAELYTGMQTGVVDGFIGGTPELAVQNFSDILKTWIQLNDHFEANFIFINTGSYEALDAADQQVLLEAAQTISLAQFDAMEATDNDYLQQMRDAGVDVVVLDPDQLDAFVSVARTDVWPEITDEVGDEIMAKLREAAGL